MNRVIKFRVWDKQNEVIYPVESLLSNSEGIKYVTIIGYRVLTFTSRKGNSKSKYIYKPHFELMQFTGLLDKNGKEIYEGDILKPSTPPSTQKENRVVEYVSGAFCYTLINHLKGYVIPLNKGRANLFEVIGNIYENKDLL